MKKSAQQLHADSLLENARHRIKTIWENRAVWPSWQYRQERVVALQDAAYPRRAVRYWSSRKAVA